MFVALDHLAVKIQKEKETYQTDSSGDCTDTPYSSFVSPHYFTPDESESFVEWMSEIGIRS